MKYAPIIPFPALCRKVPYAEPLWATVGLCELASANVVGYTTVNSKAGFNFYAPMFKNTDGSAIKIQDIKLGEGATSWADNIQILDAGGAGIAQYFYVTAADGFDADGWTEDFGTLADVTLTPGQSVIVETSSADVPITYAGEVDNATTTIKSVAGFNFVGNNVPKSINISDITLGEGATSWTDNIQILDEGGAGIAQYFYVTAADGFDADGWTEDFGTLADVTLTPGQGIIVETSNADVDITLPSAL